MGRRDRVPRKDCHCDLRYKNSQARSPLSIISVSIPPSVISRMSSSTFILRKIKPPLLRLHFSSSDVRETTLFEEGEPTYRYKVSTSRPTSYSGNKVTTVSDSRGLPIIVFRWNTYKRDEIEWVKPRQAGPLPAIKRPISAFFKLGRYYVRNRVSSHSLNRLLNHQGVRYL